MTNPGLYVHVPFCRSKCPYCAFFSIASTSLVPRWMAAFREEVCRYKGRFDLFDSLYLGGGTPSLLDGDVLAAIVKHLFTQHQFAPETEMTIEANPCDLTREKIRLIGNLGFNRISLGVQSFNDRILAFLGRFHSAERAKDVLKDLRDFGFQNISVDLMYGFRGQSLEDWVDTLKQAVAFKPEHLSCYQMGIEKQSRFGRMKEKGHWTALSEEEERDFFLITTQLLQDSGYMHYEISSYAREPQYVSRHNSKYWQHAPYLGLGPSAHSFHECRRWWDVRSIRAYCEMLEKDQLPIEGEENLTSRQLRLESIVLGLRTRQGFDQEKNPLSPRSDRMLSTLLDAGFVRVKGNRILPTTKGFLVADRLADCLSD
jgi:oxygen-independent coproporphyrinogen-3 oxidase